MELQEDLRNYIITEGLKGDIPDGFDDEYDLIDSGVIDSLFMMNLVAYLEQEHQVEFGMNDMIPKHFKTINALTAFAQSK
ncbi:phosphopantetheine-binding protein [Candidatus Albibeggiatoa sp. nov. BB20]|uniref:acyl carrier protein n=1 Tax=Candidatus Albibeggiatoa sp. nov. BB20 TaxID=3162723 RepID=UPI003365879D